MKAGLLSTFLLPLLILLSPSCSAFFFSTYKDFYSTTGEGNNPFDDDRGAISTPFRIAPIGTEEQPLYEPNPRTMCNLIGRETENNPSDHLSMFGIMFGQFVNHDLEENDVLNPQERIFDLQIPITSDEDPACFNWPPFNPTFRCQNLTENPLAVVARLSDTYLQDGEIRVNNEQTAFFDLSHVYGPTEDKAAKVRGTGGKLLTEDYALSPFGPFFNDLLPSRATTNLTIDTLFRDMNPGQVFTQGDPRVPENVALNLFHLIFTREHNRWVEELSAAHPDWDDEKLFSEAKKYTIAIYQQIIMYEYLPALVGEESYFTRTRPYIGYRPNVDPATSVAFATGALRYGHDSLQPYSALTECGLSYFSVQGNTIIGGNDTLPNIGQSGGPLTPLIVLAAAGGYENVIRGLVATPSSPIDMVFNVGIGDVPNSFGTTDLCALDIARGRNNGLPKCVQVMKAFRPVGRPPLFPYSTFLNDGYYCPTSNYFNEDPDPEDCFLRLVRGRTEQAAYLQTFASKVKDLDAFLCIELDIDDPSIPGPTLAGILIDEFVRKRDGDRFWFENWWNWQGFGPTPYYLEAKGTTFAQVVERNFDIQNLPHQILRPQPDYQHDLFLSCQA